MKPRKTTIVGRWHVAELNERIEAVVLFSDGSWNCSCGPFANAKTMANLTVPRPAKPNDCCHILKAKGVKSSATVRLSFVHLTAEGAQVRLSKFSSPAQANEKQSSGPIRKIELE